jgi:hypothetical protein
MTSRIEKNRNSRTNKFKMLIGLVLTVFILVMGLWAVDTARASEFTSQNSKMFSVSKEHGVYYMELFGNKGKVNGQKIVDKVSILLDRVQSTFKK